MPSPMQRSRQIPSNQCRPPSLSRTPQQVASSISHGDCVANSQCSSATAVSPPVAAHRNASASLSQSPILICRSHAFREPLRPAAVSPSPHVVPLSLPTSRHSEVQEPEVQTQRPVTFRSTPRIEQQVLSVPCTNEERILLATSPTSSTCARTYSPSARLRVTSHTLDTCELTLDVDSPTRGTLRHERSAKFQSGSSGSSVFSPCAAARVQRPVSCIMGADGQVVNLGDGSGNEVALQTFSPKAVCSIKNCYAACEK